MMEELVKGGAKVSHRNASGETLLLAAVDRSHLDAAKKLVLLVPFFSFSSLSSFPLLFCSLLFLFFRFFLFFLLLSSNQCLSFIILFLYFKKGS